jgi:glycosyltransferase involved in cell wall biosynthesis
MRIAFLGNYLHKRAKLGEGSSAHFYGVATGLQALGHSVLLPGRDAAHCNGTGRLALMNPWSFRNVDVAYIRMEGRPVPAPWTLQTSTARRTLAPTTSVVWEINAAPEILAYDGRHCSPSTLRILEDILRRQACQADAAICNTEGLSQFAKDIGIPHTRTIELATFPERFQPAHHRSPTIEVCWLAGNSGISWHDTETIASTIRLLSGQEHIRFHLIGEQSQLQPGPNVITHGRVGGKVLARLLEDMDVGLAIYRPGVWSRYGVFTSPLKVFDYMAAGLHVVASPIEQILKLEQHGAFLTKVPFSDPTALAAALNALHKDAKFANRCDANRALAVQQYHWRRVSAATDQFLHEITSLTRARHGRPR